VRVVGTAGHVDHGKSSLVRALTGIDPDRLKEEKARGLTIDLGFAHFDLCGVGEVSLIDVPGHRDFIENMLAGVGGIDAALLVVAADEGLMPQTREHLAILDLLGIGAGVVALTKTDLVSDPDWLALVEADVRNALAGTTFTKAPLIPLSVRTGRGLDLLQNALAETLQRAELRLDRGSPRLWIDRSFSVNGFGTVVTGTLLGGALHVGQEVEISPDGVRARIRGLQTNGKPCEVVPPGSRCAANLAGVERVQAPRGGLLTLPGSLTPTLLADVRYRHLASAVRPLRHNAEVKLFVGSAETVAHVRLLADETLAPGAEGWLQLALRDPLPLTAGDRFILRVPSPSETIGGGVLLDVHPGTRWRRFKPATLERLYALTNGFAAPDAAEAQYRANLQQMARLLTVLHATEPLRTGLAPETLRSQLKLERAPFKSFITRAQADHALLTAPDSAFALPSHVPRLTATQQSAANALLLLFTQTPFAPPNVKDAERAVTGAVLRFLVERGDLVQLSPDVLLASAAYAQAVETVLYQIERDGKIAIAGLRDALGTSRKIAQAVLEYMDGARLTRRDGDTHVIGERRTNP